MRTPNNKPQGYVTANDMALRLSFAASRHGDPDVLQALRVTPEQAQNLANDGALVVAAWQNPSGASGHVATVRADFGPYNEDAGPLLGNVGGLMGVGPTVDAFNVGGRGKPQSIGEIDFYLIPDRSR